MAIEWKVVRSKKKIRGRSPEFDYEVKRHRGHGWVGIRHRLFAPEPSHQVGPFKHKEDCITALETIDALCAPEKTPYAWACECEKMALYGAMYGTGVTTLRRMK